MHDLLIAYVCWVGYAYHTDPRKPFTTAGEALYHPQHDVDDLSADHHLPLLEEYNLLGIHKNNLG